MPPVTLCLPPMLLSSRTQDMELSMQAHLQIDLPAQLSYISTANSLLDTVVHQHLWIARKGPASIALVTSISGRLLSPGEVTQVSAWIKESDIWDCLGIRVECREDDQATWPLGTNQFSIQHPDLTSAMVAPEQALTAEFLSTTCRINIRRKDTGTDRMSLKRKRQGTKDPALNNKARKNEDEFGKALSSDDRQAIDDFISGSSPVSSQAMNTESLTLEETRRILVASVSALIQGGIKKQAGFVTRAGKECPGLMQLAPGVFHMPYLKIVSERKKLLPAISWPLAKMINGESPELRNKAISLASAYNGDGAAGSSDDLRRNVMKGIEQRAWETLLTEIKPPKLKTERPSYKQVLHTPPNAQKGSGQVDLQEPLPTPLPERESSKTLELFDDAFVDLGNSMMAMPIQNQQVSGHYANPQTPSQRGILREPNRRDHGTLFEPGSSGLYMANHHSQQTFGTFGPMNHRYTEPDNLIQNINPVLRHNSWNYTPDPAIYGPFDDHLPDVQGYT